MKKRFSIPESKILQMKAPEQVGFKEFIFSSLFNYEKKILKDGLKILGYKFEDFFYPKDIIKDKDQFIAHQILSFPESDVAGSIEQKLKKFTNKDLAKIESFLKLTIKFNFIIIQYLISKNDFESAIKITEGWIEAINQYHDRYGEDLPQEYLELRSKISQQNEELKQKINGTEAAKKDNLYYWPYTLLKLKLLHELLVEEKLIINNPFFVQSFSNLIVSEDTKTSWLGSQTNLFCLLYFLYNKSRHYKGERLNKISRKLFIISNIRKKRGHSVQNFSNFLIKCNDKLYLEKKHENILSIIKKLDLKND